MIRLEMAICADRGIYMKHKMKISPYHNSAKFESCLRVIGSKLYVISGKNRNCNKAKTKAFCKTERSNKRARQ